MLDVRRTALLATLGALAACTGAPASTVSPTSSGPDSGAGDAGPAAGPVTTPPGDTPAGPAGTPSPTPAPDGGAAPAGGGGGRWVTVASEDFEHLDPGSPAWGRDPVPDDGPFADAGVFFASRGVTPPAAWRISQPLGAAGWLTAESYTRTDSTPFPRLVSVVADPADPSNHVLRIASPAHTDATVVRSTSPLPQRYRVSLRVGFASFGDGLPGLNGYATGNETAEPWWPDLAKTQNGFYELAILDAPPRPHNNTWIHHHRKVVFDSDNNYPPWMEVFDGSRFVTSGEHPIMMFAIDGRGPDSAQGGKPFLAYSGGDWQQDRITAVDAYLPDQWYTFSIERFDTRFTLQVSGRFRYGGETTYQASIDAAQRCVWHFNRSAAEDASACVDARPYDGLGPEYPQWPASATWPDFFMFGDPHSNFYMGQVLYDDVKLETWQP